jgi:hypothetical protein
MPDVLRTGCAWRHLRHDFAVSWSAARKHFLRWCRNRTWARILTTVCGEVRIRSGRRRRPTAGGGFLQRHGVPGNRAARVRRRQKVDGVKGHMLVDSAGVLVAAVVTPADVQDRAAFPKLLRKANGSRPPSTTCGSTRATPAKPSPGPQPRPVSPSTSCPGRNPDTASSSTATIGRRTHQRLDQPLPPHRPPLRNHPPSTRRLRLPQPNRPTTQGTRPQPVVRHALGGIRFGSPRAALESRLSFSVLTPRSTPWL